MEKKKITDGYQNTAITAPSAPPVYDTSIKNIYHLLVGDVRARNREVAAENRNLEMHNGELHEQRQALHGKSS